MNVVEYDKIAERGDALLKQYCTNEMLRNFKDNKDIEGLMACATSAVVKTASHFGTLDDLTLAIYALMVVSYQLGQRDAQIASGENLLKNLESKS